MKNKKGILIILITLLILCIIMIILLNNLKNQKEKNEIKAEREDTQKVQEDASIIINGEKLKEVRAEGIYLTIEGIIQKYNDYLDKKDAKAIYNVLYEEYITKHNLKEESIMNKIERYSNYDIKQLVGLSTINYGIYYAKLNVENNEKFLMVNWDIENNTFSISPIEKNIYDEGINQGIEVNKERISPIKANAYNNVTIISTR